MIALQFLISDEKQQRNHDISKKNMKWKLFRELESSFGGKARKNKKKKKSYYMKYFRIGKNKTRFYLERFVLSIFFGDEKESKNLSVEQLFSSSNRKIPRAWWGLFQRLVSHRKFSTV